MATVEWTQTAPRAKQAARAGGAPALLGAALLVLCGYAVFAQGATSSPAEPRLQVALAVTALVTGALLWTGHLRLRAPRLITVALGLSGAFALWCGLSVVWSAAPDGSWIEFNRVCAYALALGLAICFGASAKRPTLAVIWGLEALAALVTLYALGQKVFPGLRISGLINLDQTGGYSRLEQPLGYWNALALLFACCAPALLVQAARAGASRRSRIFALVILQLLVVAGGFTESRGGIIALAIALAATIWLSGAALRHLAWAVTAVVGGLVPLIVALAAQPLTADGVSLPAREHAGLLLLLVLAASVTVLALAGERLCERESTLKLSPARRHRIWRSLAILGGSAVLVVVLVEIAKDGGIGGAFTHLRYSLTSPKQVSVSNPNRLFSTDSADRWAWWHQALGAWWSRPLAGWGAGSFKVVNLLYRHDTLSASDAHSVPLQWLAETGMIGGALAIGAWVQLLRGGVRALRGAGAERWAAAALLASALAYTVHACYDWDWEIPGVTLPVLVILGVLGAAVTLPAGKPATETYRPVAATGRTALLAIGSCLLCVFAVSAILPGIAASRASGSLIEASAGRLVAAQHDANLATRLDPLSDAGPLASEAIALQLKSLRLARSDLIEALRREPDDWRAWLTLGSVDGSLGRWPEVLSAAQRAIALNPEMDDTQLVQVAIAARAANVNQAPPEGSATAQP